MPSFKRLEKDLKDAKHIEYSDNSKFILMSDCHRGDGNWDDDFAPNQNIYFGALQHYYNQSYTYIELGDGDELWENSKFSTISKAHNDVLQLLNEFYESGRMHLIFGNHDIVKRNNDWMQKNYSTCQNVLQCVSPAIFCGATAHSAIVLKHAITKREIFLLHGHQVDFLNSSLWPISRFLVRYIWRPLELWGVHDPTRAAESPTKTNSIERKLRKLAKTKKQIVIAGHTHRPVFAKVGEPAYFNDGCAVHPRCITGIEIENGQISLIKWSVKTRTDGTLFIAKDLLAGPQKISDFYSL